MFNDFKDLNKYKYYINSISLIIAIIFSLLNYFLVSFLLIFLYIVSNFIIKKSNNKTVNDFDTLNFLNNLIKKYKLTNNLLNSLKYANTGNFYFSYSLTNSIIKYSLGYNSYKTFSNLYTFNSAHLKRLIELLIIGLDDGIDIYAPLCELRDNIRKEQKNYIKTYGIIKNTQSINMLSSTFFLPLFSGISLNIIKFSNLFNSTNSTIINNINSLVFLFIYYFFIVNYMNTHERKNDSNLFLFYSTMSVTLFLFTFRFVSNIW